MELRFTHREISAAREAINSLHGLQECIIEDIAWAEIPLELVFRLSYIWTEAGEVCFSVGKRPRDVFLRFELVNEFQMSNALTSAMLEEPGKINWGISEIAGLSITPSQGSDEYGKAEFFWEGPRRISVLFRALTVKLSTPEEDVGEWRGKRR